jgi:hypothetical protein
MAMSEERARILQMVSEGKINAEQGVELLKALKLPKAPQPSSEGGISWMRVRVTDMETGRTRVNVNLPISLVRAGIRLGARFSPEMEDIDWEEVIAAIQEGASGKLVDVEDIEGGEKVEVFVE